MNVLGIIPARGGSKGIPKKNMVDLGGKPLIAWTIEAARASGLDRLVVSTDSPEIAAVAAAYGCEVPTLRPSHLSDDNAPALPVIQHMLDVLEAAEGYSPQAIAYLQPTSPFRRTSGIDAALRLIAAGAQTVVSVVRVPHNMVPSSLMRMDGDRLEFMTAPSARQFRRQTKEVLYARNGPAVLASRIEVIRGGNLYGRDIRPIVMDALTSLDIDEPADLDMARALLALVEASTGGAAP